MSTPLHQILWSVAKSYHRLRGLTGTRWCPACEKRVAAFHQFGPHYPSQWAKHQFDHEARDFEMLNPVEYSCPVCGASDRDRLCALYVRERLRQLPAAVELVDFAPSPALRRWLKRQTKIRYRSADLFMNDVDDVVDICRMPQYGSESFDCFICSHVLEHVENDRAALGELFRILRRGGWGIILTPISMKLDQTREGSALDEAERWRRFGQGDHLRLYSRADFVDRLREAGFRVQELTEHYFGSTKFWRAGISPGSVLYVVERPKAGPGTAS